MVARAWWRARAIEEGEEPDYRFTLANERTFLAWIRTSLALLAGGIALQAFVDDVPADLRRVMASLLIVLGAVLGVGAFVRWLRTEQALRRRTSLPPPGLAPWLAAGIAVTALTLLAYVALGS